MCSLLHAVLATRWMFWKLRLSFATVVLEINEANGSHSSVWMDVEIPRLWFHSVDGPFGSFSSVRCTTCVLAQIFVDHATTELAFVSTKTRKYFHNNDCPNVMISMNLSKCEEYNCPDGRWLTESELELSEHPWIECHFRPSTLALAGTRKTALLGTKAKRKEPYKII
jgi:ribosomal protein S27E